MSDRPFLPSDISDARARGARDFGHVVRHVLAAGVGAQAHAAANRATPRIVLATRAAVAGSALADSDALASYADVESAWLAALAQASVFDRMLPSMRAAPMLQRFGISTQAIIADEVVEGRAIPVASLVVDGATALQPRKAAAIVVATRELVRTSGAAGLIDAELRAAVAAGSDALFLADLVAATTPISSTSSIADVDALLAAVPLGTTSAPFFVFDVDSAKILATQRENSVRLWPEMSPMGGSIAGVPTLVTDQLAAGTALLVDASGIAANAGEVALDSSSVADILMDSAPAMQSRGGSPTAPIGAQLTSMFMSNSVAAKATRSLGFKILRASAIASLFGVNYGGSP